MSTPTQFPILGHEAKHPRACDFPNASIPWAMIASHEKQALHNHSQTLTHLASRGGLDYSEAIAVLEDRPWERMDPMQALVKLADMVKQWKAGTTKQQPIRELLREIVDYMDAWKEATGIDPDAANLDEVFDTDFQRNHRKKLDELKAREAMLRAQLDAQRKLTLEWTSNCALARKREEGLRAEVERLTKERDKNTDFNQELAVEFEEALGPHPTIPNGQYIQRIKELREDRDKLRGKVFMPGTWHCDVCGFELNQRVLNPNTGAVGTPLMTEVPTCPNKDGSVMRQVTWEECAGENEKAAHRFLDERDEARKRYDIARMLSDENLITIVELQGDARVEAFDAIVDDVIKRSTSPLGTDTSFDMPPGPPEAA